ncbi:MAG: sigma-70 family RNA polymerase sigma factor [Rikenellaceae bacterium]
MNNEEFKRYIESISGRMMRFAVAILRSEADAEDVVSGVVERLWHRREHLLSDGSASSFAMSAVRNGCYDHLRYMRRRHSVELTERLEAANGEISSDRVEMVRYAIGQLPDRQREVLHLKDIEGYEVEEIAKLLDIEPTNVRMILSRARRSLREIILKQMKR